MASYFLVDTKVEVQSGFFYSNLCSMCLKQLKNKHKNRATTLKTTDLSVLLCPSIVCFTMMKKQKIKYGRKSRI